MGEVWMEGIGGDVGARSFGRGGCETPSFLEREGFYLDESLGMEDERRRSSPFSSISQCTDV